MKTRIGTSLKRASCWNPVGSCSWPLVSLWDTDFGALGGWHATLGRQIGMLGASHLLGVTWQVSLSSGLGCKEGRRPAGRRNSHLPSLYNLVPLHACAYLVPFSLAWVKNMRRLFSKPAFSSSYKISLAFVCSNCVLGHSPDNIE